MLRLLITRTQKHLAWAGCLASVVCSACSASDYGDIKPIAIDVDVEDPKWDTGIGELIARKCDNCHAKTPSKFVPGEIRDNPKRYQLGLSSSEDTFLNYGALSFERVFKTTDDPMPPKYGTPLTDTEKQALEKYLKEKGFGVEAPVDARAAFLTETCKDVAANALTFAADVATFASNTCLGCHSSSARFGDVVLESAADWKANREALVWVLAQDGEGKNVMPQGRAAGYTEPGQPGEIPLRYLCGSPEVTSGQ